jgi:hemoglobin
LGGILHDKKFMSENTISHEELEAWIKSVSTHFYEAIYEDAWLKEVFVVIRRETITSQQIDFMVGAFGGPKRYAGRSPSDAHPHIFIDENMWARREELLVDAFNKAGLPAWMQEKWLKIENAFKRSMVMSSPSECKKRFFTDELIIVPSPYKKAG